MMVRIPATRKVKMMYNSQRPAIGSTCTWCHLEQSLVNDTIQLASSTNHHRSSHFRTSNEAILQNAIEISLFGFFIRILDLRKYRFYGEKDKSGRIHDEMNRSSDPSFTSIDTLNHARYTSIRILLKRERRESIYLIYFRGWCLFKEDRQL